MRSTKLTIVRPGEGRSIDLGPGFGVDLKLGGDDTAGAISVVEHPFAPGAWVPPHLHTYEDEYSIVLEGQIGFRSGDQEVTLGPGGYITKPRNELHAMWNAGRAPARMIDHLPSRLRAIFRGGSRAVLEIRCLFRPAVHHGLSRPLWPPF